MKWPQLNGDDKLASAANQNIRAPSQEQRGTAQNVGGWQDGVERERSSHCVPFSDAVHLYHMSAIFRVSKWDVEVWSECVTLLPAVRWEKITDMPSYPLFSKVAHQATSGAYSAGALCAEMIAAP